MRASRTDHPDRASHGSHITPGAGGAGLGWAAQNVGWIVTTRVKIHRVLGRILRRQEAMAFSLWRARCNRTQRQQQMVQGFHKRVAQRCGLRALHGWAERICKLQVYDRLVRRCELRRRRGAVLGVLRAWRAHREAKVLEERIVWRELMRRGRGMLRRAFLSWDSLAQHTRGIRNIMRIAARSAAVSPPPGGAQKCPLPSWWARSAPSPSLVGAQKCPPPFPEVGAQKCPPPSQVGAPFPEVPPPPFPGGGVEACLVLCRALRLRQQALRAARPGLRQEIAEMRAVCKRAMERLMNNILRMAWEQWLESVDEMKGFEQYRQVARLSRSKEEERALAYERNVEMIDQRFQLLVIGRYLARWRVAAERSARQRRIVQDCSLARNHKQLRAILGEWKLRLTLPSQRKGRNQAVLLRALKKRMRRVTMQAFDDWRSFTKACRLKRRKLVHATRLGTSRRLRRHWRLWATAQEELLMVAVPPEAPPPATAVEPPATNVEPPAAPPPATAVEVPTDTPDERGAGMTAAEQEEARMRRLEQFVRWKVKRHLAAAFRGWCEAQASRQVQKVKVARMHRRSAELAKLGTMRQWLAHRRGATRDLIKILQTNSRFFMQHSKLIAPVLETAQAGLDVWHSQCKGTQEGRETQDHKDMAAHAKKVMSSTLSHENDKLVWANNAPIKHINLVYPADVIQQSITQAATIIHSELKRLQSENAVQIDQCALLNKQLDKVHRNAKIEHKRMMVLMRRKLMSAVTDSEAKLQSRMQKLAHSMNTRNWFTWLEEIQKNIVADSVSESHFHETDSDEDEAVEEPSKPTVLLPKPMNWKTTTNDGPCHPAANEPGVWSEVDLDCDQIEPQKNSREGRTTPVRKSRGGPHVTQGTGLQVEAGAFVIKSLNAETLLRDPLLRVPAPATHRPGMTARMTRVQNPTISVVASSIPAVHPAREVSFGAQEGRAHKAATAKQQDPRSPLQLPVIGVNQHFSSNGIQPVPPPSAPQLPEDSIHSRRYRRISTHW
ncbi:hypothetical protein CYMTET_3750 [Cymbomonas tetramitiformis]|uniref:Uncharacterized protein n=1 Tax=Cymbomonas tetramitiformis TaxID=36881 RepID=A0AAE0H2I8_9CHLO|nr:hypothetical protein CYMTET_3750 [Cymbomonas tetramitiformis]